MITGRAMTIRSIKETDNKHLTSVIRRAFEEYKAPTEGTVYSDPTTDNLFQLFQAKRSVLWVAEMDEQIVGCCGIYPTRGLPSEYVELVKFYLSSEARGRGIGKALMEKSIQSAKELGYTSVYLESLPDFGNAVNIYKKQGFRQLQKPLGHSGHTSCTIWMLKEL